MSDIERREIHTLRTKLDEAIQERDEAREAARYFEKLSLVPYPECRTEWITKWPWITEAE